MLALPTTRIRTCALLVAGLSVLSCLEKDLSTTASPPSEPPTVLPQASLNELDSPCSPPAGLSGAPESIDQLVTYLNAMSHPLSLDCFLQSLDRPLRMRTTKSFFSAQPAVGRRSPRIFLFLGPLVLSVVPEGEASSLLEMGEETELLRSIKAEIAFPVETTLTTSSPFERLPLAEVTACGVCHDKEVPVRNIDGAVVSERLRPAVRELVPVAELREQFEQCDEQAEPRRCAMLDALFGYGSVVEQGFPEALPTIFD